MPRRDVTPEQRFWAKVRRDPNCWEWTASTNGTPGWEYGQFKFNGRMVPAHRLSFEWSNGPIPPGMFVCHRCDNPICVRPSHLFLGTRQDNMNDMKQKGRHRSRSPRGARHWRAVLSERNVAQIRRCVASGATHRSLALRYGVSRQCIGKIVRGLTWTEKEAS